MNRRGFFQRLAALIALPFVPKTAATPIPDAMRQVYSKEVLDASRRYFENCRFVFSAQNHTFAGNKITIPLHPRRRS